MSAKYIKKEIADLNGTGRTQAYYKMETRAMSHKQFVNLCSRSSAFQDYVVDAVLKLVAEKLPLCLAEGSSVKIEGIGTFTAKLGVRSDMVQDAFEPGETRRNAGTIVVKGVSYRADNDLIRETRRKCILERGGESRLRKPKAPQEERVAMARKYLERHRIMRVNDYAQLTGLSKTTASMELRKIVLDPASGITYEGWRSQKIYILRPSQPG